MMGKMMMMGNGVLLTCCSWACESVACCRCTKRDNAHVLLYVAKPTNFDAMHDSDNTQVVQHECSVQRMTCYINVSHTVCSFDTVHESVNVSGML